MLKLLRYVHQNPVRAELCRSVEEYEWSSGIYYRKNIKGFINTGIIYNMLDKDTISAIHKYKEFMSEPEETNYSTLTKEAVLKSICTGLLWLRFLSKRGG